MPTADPWLVLVCILFFLLFVAYIHILLRNHNLHAELSKSREEYFNMKAKANGIAQVQEKYALESRKYQEELEALKKIKPKQTIDAQKILHDLTSEGEALVRIIPIDQNDFFTRSPV